MVDPEKKLNGFDKYQKAILDVVSESAKSFLQENKKGLLECYCNLLFDEEGATKLGKELLEDEKFLSTIFNGFIEIAHSYQSLLDYEIYIRCFPYSDTRITKTRYLSHLIEAYLHEVYILRERLVNFLNELNREYKADRRRLEIEKHTKALKNYVLECLEPISDIRSRHVHRIRYRNRDIDKLGFLELVAPSDPAFAALYEQEYGKIRKKLKDKISKTNKIVEKILDKYFDDLYDVFFPMEGKLIYLNSI